jgi:hypothetical protein
MVHPTAYRLTPKVKTELEQVQAEAEQRLRKIVKSLFRSSVGGWRDYEGPFLRCLSTVFTKLSEKYVGLLAGELSRADFFQQVSFEYAIREAKAAYPEIDEPSLRSGTTAFFMEDGAEYGALKWNLAQNFYVAKALGLDPSGALLSAEVFGNTEFYLDTNVLISALEPVEANHRTFRSLGKACKHLGVKLSVCQISLDELRHVVEANKDMLRRSADVVPEALAPKVRTIFYDLYLKSEDRKDIDSLFGNFSHPVPTLRDSYGVELVDSVWFSNESLSEGTGSLAEKLRTALPFRKKTKSAARHDAMLVRWVQSERSKSQSKVWIVTRDRTLPTVLSNEGEPLAITLDALLQWIAPITTAEYSESDFIEMFSESMRLQLLPPENFFELRDFCLLADFGVSCKDLPAEDVEACIRHLKTVVPAMDPTEARDREKISHHIARFFADPGRRFKEKLRSVESLRGDEKAELTAQLAEKDRDLYERDQALQKIRQEVQGQNVALAEQTAEIESLTRQSIELRKRSARCRALVLAVGYALLQSAIVLEAWLHGGTTEITRASTAVTVLGAVTLVFRWIGRTWIGSHGVELMGPTTKKLLGA